MKQKLALLALVSLTACGASLPDAKVVIDQADCKVHVLLSALENDRSLVEMVLDGRVDLTDALAIVSAVDEQQAVVRAQLKACEEIVSAPPPAPGDKVL